MALLSDRERPIAEALAGLSEANPFLPERVERERSALGKDFVVTGDVWAVEDTLDGVNPNLGELSELAGRLASDLRARLAAGTRATRDELPIYEALVRYLLYARYEADWLELIRRGEEGRGTTQRIDAYGRFARDVDSFFKIPGVAFSDSIGPERLFGWGYQIRRAFHHTFRRIYGGSMPAARLRAAVWQSIFTHDQGRYRRILYDGMSEIPTLVVGESGTGKELVARAIALSRFVPFDAGAQCFEEDYTLLFHALNVAALSSSLVESELFGHKRGSFTGAIQDREGWLETCSGRGTVFLDEIGELSAEIQVKLLRVLESRTFQRVGETQERSFRGKIVAATNRDLADEMESGRFRQDLYYRLCADVIRTPTLREQLRDSPRDLHNLVRVIARRLVGTEEEERLADEVERWCRELPADYAWPGNVRELEQCVRNVLIRKEYRPSRRSREPERALLDQIRDGALTAEELLRGYCTLVYARTGNYEAAARRLEIDRRTVKARVDPDLLASLRG